jgi:uncharacterized protein YceK
MTRALACGVFTLSLTLTGCGTVGNLSGPENLMTPGPPQLEVYGGVANDVRWIKNLNETGGINTRLMAAALVLDVPLSAVADTITLPVTMWATVDRAYTSEPPPSPEEKQYWQQFWGVEESRPLPVESKP